MARDDYGRSGRGRHGRWDAQRDAANESGREASGYGREAGYGREPRSRDSRELGEHELYGSRSPRGGYGGERDYPDQRGYASADMDRSRRGRRAGGRDLDLDEDYDAMPDEGYTRAMGNADTEWGAGAGGGYGRSGNYGHRGGTGRWSGAPSGRTPDEDDRYDRSYADRGAGSRDYGMRPYDDRESRPNHAGRGPKNYRRSDDRITEEINEALTRHRDIDATEIEVRCESGVVTLTGTVDSKHAKRLAEDLAEDASGVRDVNNELRVQRGESNPGRDESRFASDREVTRTTARETGPSGSRGVTTNEGKSAKGRARNPETRK
jgi:osmotically-inducible protein OsmY